MGSSYTYPQFEYEAPDGKTYSASMIVEWLREGNWYIEDHYPCSKEDEVELDRLKTDVGPKEYERIMANFIEEETSDPP